MTDANDAVSGASEERSELAGMAERPRAGYPGPQRSATNEHDSLPEELDVQAALVGPYTFPDIRRRLFAGTWYTLIAMACMAGYLVSDNPGLLAAAITLALIAFYHRLCAWPLAIDQTEALAVASRTVGFAVGHASAQVTWRGLRSRPAWRVLVYSAEEPPTTRGLVELDAVDGHVLYQFSEDNPEDWSQFADSTTQPNAER